MTPIRANLQAVKMRIAAAARTARRAPENIALLAVSKTFGAARVRECHTAGQRAFGENYLQEALEKIAALADAAAHDTIEWHISGCIALNATKSRNA